MSFGATRFHGVASLAGAGSDPPQQYLVLEDLTSGMQQPCVLDIKVGRQSWEPGVSAEKAAREASKWPPQSALGFRFTGMQVSVRSGAVWSKTRVGTSFAYALDVAGVVDALAAFLAPNPAVLGPQLLDQLTDLLRLQRLQHEYTLYGSSILVTYDAASEAPVLRLTLIDFGHPVPSADPTHSDAGYIHGIETLLLFVACALSSAMQKGHGPTANATQQ